jgi:hypothetical protein
MSFFIYDYQWISYLASILSTIIAFTVFGLLIKKNLIKHSKIIILLAMSIILLGFAACIDAIFFTINGIYHNIQVGIFDIVTIGSYLSFYCNALSNCFLLKFTKEVFHEKQNKPSWFILYVLEILIGPGLFLSTLQGIEDIYVTLIHVGCSLIIYTLLSYNAFYLSKKVKLDDSNDRVAYLSLNYIGMSGILLFCALCMFVIHEIMLMIPITEFITVTLGWSLGAIAGMVIYVGYIVPEWIKKRWNRN